MKFRITLDASQIMNIGPAHDKTYRKTCVTSEESDQPVHLPSMARVFVCFFLNSLEAVEGTCDQGRL